MNDDAPSPRARKHRDDGLATRKRIEAAALELFRKKGFDRTTMRDVARRARVSLGLAYHYFPSKEAFVLAYYRGRQDEHVRAALAELAKTSSLAARVRVSILTKLDLLHDDRALLVALTRVLLDPTSPLSAFSDETRETREQAIALFRTVVEHPDVAPDLRDAAATALWAAHMGVLLRFVYDTSEGARETRDVVEAIVEMVPSVASLLSMPMLEPMRASLVARLSTLGFVAHVAALVGPSRA